MKSIDFENFQLWSKAYKLSNIVYGSEVLKKYTDSQA